MKKILSIAFVILLTFSLQAQGTKSIKVYGISLDTIASYVKKHPKYFDHLAKKILMKDKNPADDELIMLYYGSAFMKNYNPKKEDKDVGKIAKQMAELDFSGAILEGEKLLKVYPVNARLYMLIGYAYKKIGEKIKSKWYYKRYGAILRIPLNSNTGNSFEQAFLVRSISDEYLILNQKDLELNEQALRYHNQLPYDVLQVQNKSRNNKRATKLSKKKLYFNIYLPFFVGQGKSFKSELKEAKEKYRYKE
jgi:hypothetical protein